MEPKIRKRLLEINQEFYDRFAPSFSVTRGRVQPGVRKLLPRLLKAETILDIGCGNGTLARALAGDGFQGEYLGVDMSEGLLQAARQTLGSPSQGHFAFLQSDLANPGWVEKLPFDHYDFLVSFAVLHHLPDNDFRKQIVQAFHHLVAPVGRWQSLSGNGRTAPDSSSV